jgi:hypothetical protein
VFYKAFQQYVQTKWRKMYNDLYDLVEGFMFAVLITALAQPWLIHVNDWLLDTRTIVPVYLTLWTVGMALMPPLRMLLSAFCYGCRFYGDYEIIHGTFGYRAFRVTPAQQEYLALYYEKRPRKKELIIASAIIDGSGTIWCVEKPGRHHHCIWYMAQHAANKQEHTQGFLTNQYRFIGREAGRLLALHTGQVKRTDHDEDLFSEDLWDTPEHLRYKG